MCRDRGRHPGNRIRNRCAMMSIGQIDERDDRSGVNEGA